MTAGGFVKQCTEYYGDWPRYTIGLQVKSWANTKSQSYLDAMWAMVRDNREASFGPPDLAFLNKHADEAARAMKRAEPQTPQIPADDPNYAHVTAEEIARWNQVDGGIGDRYLSRREACEALAIVYERLMGKASDNSTQHTQEATA
jgi:hypothetical protein